MADRAQSASTESVRRPVRSAGHTRQITVRLLKAIVSALELDNKEGPIPDPSRFQVLRGNLGLRVRTLLDMVER